MTFSKAEDWTVTMTVSEKARLQLLFADMIADMKKAKPAAAAAAVPHLSNCGPPYVAPIHRNR